MTCLVWSRMHESICSHLVMLLLVLLWDKTCSFSVRTSFGSTQSQSRSPTFLCGAPTSSSPSSVGAGQGFGVVDSPEPPTHSLSSEEAKQKLLDLLPRMMGTEQDFRAVERYVNTLEESYVPAQTLGFLNLAMAGDWQLLFSTNLVTSSGSGGPNNIFRMRELVQRIEPNHLEGNVTTVALWDLAQDDDDDDDDDDNNNNNNNNIPNRFDATGTFSVKTVYQINQGARMVLNEPEHILEPARGSTIPKDVPALVGLLHRAMPKELFDASDHSIDTTYLDANVRIVRITGPRLEGVRDIFIRRGSMEIN